MTWLPTRKGVPFDLLNPDWRVLCVEDLAHNLSQINRFTGSAEEPYSVAQHCVLVAAVLEDEWKLAGLVHDLSEAIYGDITTPIKDLIGREHFAVKFRHIDLAVFMAVTGGDATRAIQLLNDSHSPEVKEADLRVMLTERNWLLQPCKKEWELTRDLEPYDFKITPWPAQAAEEKFLEVFHKLTAKEEVLA